MSQFNFFTCFQCVEMEKSDWLVELLNLKDVWKSATTQRGALFVTIYGEPQMQM